MTRVRKVVRDERAARDDAMARVDEPLAEEWRAVVFRAISAVARRKRFFTARDVWEKLAEWEVPSPKEKKALGPQLAAAGRAGVCQKTGRTRPEGSHLRPIEVWESLMVEKRIVRRTKRS